MKSLLHEHRWLIGTIAVYVIGAMVATELVGPPAELKLSLYFAESSAVGVLTATVAIGVGYLGHTIFVRRPERPLRFVVRHLRGEFLKPTRLAAGLLVVVLLPPFISTFSSLKAMISHVHPFSLDPTFAQLDRFLHGGVDPWRLLQPVLGTPAVTSAVSFVYGLWFFATFTAVLWYAFSREDLRLRRQFLLSFVVTWILLGTVAATALSSAGPCYFGRVTGGPDPFAPLMEYLYEVAESHPVWALSAQERLWDLYESSTTGIGAGISAMPSVHVATAFLIWLAVRRTNRIAGVLAGLFFALILLGSVHLGWHYAIDGYAGALGAGLIWWLLGRMSKRDSAVRPARPG